MSETEQRSICSYDEDLRSRSSYSDAPFAVPAGEAPLVTASRAVQMAWQVLHNLLPKSTMAASLLLNARKMSSSCTGAYTSEMGLAIIAKTVDDSGLLEFPVGLKSSSCHEPRAAHTTM